MRSSSRSSPTAAWLACARSAPPARLWTKVDHAVLPSRGNPSGRMNHRPRTGAQARGLSTPSRRPASFSCRSPTSSPSKARCRALSSGWRPRWSGSPPEMITESQGKTARGEPPAEAGARAGQDTRPTAARLSSWSRRRSRQPLRRPPRPQPLRSAPQADALDSAIDPLRGVLEDAEPIAAEPVASRDGRAAEPIRGRAGPPSRSCRAIGRYPAASSQTTSPLPDDRQPRGGLLTGRRVSAPPATGTPPRPPRPPSRAPTSRLASASRRCRPPSATTTRARSPTGSATCAAAWASPRPT